MPVEWSGRFTIDDGSIVSAETCFSGQAVVAPKGSSATEVLDEVDLPHELLNVNERSCEWRSITQGNRTMRHETTQAISLDVVAPLSAKVTVEVNGQCYEHSLAEILRRGNSHFLRGWLSEAICIGPLVPIEECSVEAEWIDTTHSEVDVYRLQVAQHNGQWAWLSPIWAER